MITCKMLLQTIITCVFVVMLAGNRADADLLREKLDIKGTVTDIHGVPVSNAAVSIKESPLGTVTNLKGYFELTGIPEHSTLSIIHPDFEPVEINVRKSGKDYEVVLKGKPGMVSQRGNRETKKITENETSGSNIVLEKWPRFPGGTKELVKFLAHHMRYPSEALKAGVEGQASVSFFLDEKGNISSPVIVNGPGWGIDEEAVRLVQSMPQWTPARQNGKPVAVRYTIVIPFDLEIQKLPIHIREKQPDIYSRKTRLAVSKPVFKSGTEFKQFFDKSLNLSQKEPPKVELYRYHMITRPVLKPLPAVDMKFKK